MSDPAVPHLVSVDRHPNSDPAVVVNPTLAYHPLDGILGLDSTEKCYVASWTRPHTALSTTTDTYNLTLTPVAWPRL